MPVLEARLSNDFSSNAVTVLPRALGMHTVKCFANHHGKPVLRVSALQKRSEAMPSDRPALGAQC